VNEVRGRAHRLGLVVLTLIVVVVVVVAAAAAPATVIAVCVLAAPSPGVPPPRILISKASVSWPLTVDPSVSVIVSIPLLKEATVPAFDASLGAGVSSFQLPKCSWRTRTWVR
jgi:hypothetical protein